jgi:hypothetical protein
VGEGSKFLDAQPGLRVARERSAVWPAIKERDALPGLEPGAYVVRGDVVGDEDDLYVDTLARGSAPRGPDALARRLFEELPADLQAVVLNGLRNAGARGGEA